MSQEVQDALVEALAVRAPKLESFSVTWYGGEPTTAWDVVVGLSERFIEICDKYNVAYNAQMISNAYLLDKSKVDDLERIRIGLIQVTIDGHRDYHDSRRVLLSGKGSYDRIIENLANLYNHSCKISIRVNVDDRNKEGVYIMLDDLHAKGISSCNNMSVYFAAVGVTTEQTHAVAGFCFTRKSFAQIEVEFYKYASKLGLATIPYPHQAISSCIASRPDGFVVQPDGSLHKCWDTVGQEQYAVGHILRERSVSEQQEYTRWMSWDPFAEDLECSSCSWLTNCMGGCPLKVVHPEMDPSGKVSLECTTFKFNSKDMLPLFEPSTYSEQIRVLE